MTRDEHLATIKQADHEYYDLDNPSLSDAEYDELRRSYIDKYGAEDLNYVPGSVSSDFEEFRHPTPVISLEKWTKGKDDEKDLRAKIEKLWPVEVQPKFDGLTIVAYPNPDGSCKFVTRGGGDTGEVLPNFIPMYEGPGINNSDFAIRGEAFITPENFERLNAALIADGEEPKKSIRNIASGIVRRKDRSPYLHLLSFVVYDLPGQDMTPVEMRKIVGEQTKFTFTDGYSFETVDEVIEGVERIHDDILSLGIYPIDGMVIKSCQQNSGYRFGSTAHHVRNATAWKTLMAQEEFETTLIDVIWQMGKSKATPVGVIEPTNIDGATVNRVTLNNAAWIKERGIKLNSRIAVRRSGHVIPNFVRVIEPGDKDIVLDVCPACGGPLEEINGQQFCINPDCSERIARNIAFMASKDVLDINGLSIETARKLVDHWKKGHPGERFNQNIIFRTSVRDFEQLEGFGERSAFKIRQAIVRRQTNVELPRFIKALCIPGIGNDVGKKLADHFGSLWGMANERKDQGSTDAFVKNVLLKINGIGPVVAETVASQEFWDAVDNLKELVIIAPYEKEESVMVGEFVGKTFVLTGKGPQSRSYYENLIVEAGAKVGKAVNSKTDFLVMADVNSTSSKAKKARELGTELISYEKMEKMLAEPKKG